MLTYNILLQYIKRIHTQHCLKRIVLCIIYESKKIEFLLNKSVFNFHTISNVIQYRNFSRYILGLFYEYSLNGIYNIYDMRECWSYDFPWRYKVRVTASIIIPHITEFKEYNSFKKTCLEIRGMYVCYLLLQQEQINFLIYIFLGMYDIYPFVSGYNIATIQQSYL